MGSMPNHGAYALVDLASGMGQEIYENDHNPDRERYVVQYQWADLCIGAGKMIVPSLRHPPLFARGSRPMQIFLHAASIGVETAYRLRDRLEVHTLFAVQSDVDDWKTGVWCMLPRIRGEGHYRRRQCACNVQGNSATLQTDRYPALGRGVHRAAHGVHTRETLGGFVVRNAS